MAEIEITAACGECGRSLNISREDDNSGRGRASYEITIEPCEHCLSDKYDDGYTNGRVDGYEDGREEMRGED